jgi:uncharacterized surface protein with fasciclin (FAS1) repeats
MKLVKLDTYIFYFAVIAFCCTSLVREVCGLRDSDASADAEPDSQGNAGQRQLGKYVSIEGSGKRVHAFDREHENQENPIIAYEQQRLHRDKMKNDKNGRSQNTPAVAPHKTSYETIQPTMYGTNYGTNFGTSGGTIQTTIDGSLALERKGNRGRNMKVMKNKRPKSVTIAMPFPTTPNGKGHAKGVKPPTNQGTGMGNMMSKGKMKTKIRTPAPTPITSAPTPIFTSKRSKGSKTSAPTPITSAPTTSSTSKRSKGSKNDDQFCDQYTFSRRKLQSGGADCSPNILDVASSNSDLSIFVLLVELTNLDRVFDCPGPFTCQPPTNDAFLSLGQDVLDDLMKRENRNELRNILLYHILPDAILSDEFESGDYQTLSGDDVQVSVNPLEFNGVGTVDIDEITCNGVLHTVRSLLLPDRGTFILSYTSFQKQLEVDVAHPGPFSNCYK